MEHFKELVIRLQTLNLEIATVDSPDSIDSGYPFMYCLAAENPVDNPKLNLELEMLKQKALLDTITRILKTKIYQTGMSITEA